jgi:hypothetical protein
MMQVVSGGRAHLPEQNYQTSTYAPSKTRYTTKDTRHLGNLENVKKLYAETELPPG